MIVDLRTYTMIPGRLNAWLKLYETDGYPIHVRHLGEPQHLSRVLQNSVVSASGPARSISQS